MTDNQALRTTILADSDPLGSKQRFGLFSHPISTAIGDDGPYKTKLHPRADSGKGKPLTQAKNIYSGPCRTGQLKKSFFGQINSLASTNTKDQYLDPARRLLKQENQRFHSGHKNQNNFKPASVTGSDILWKSSYQYVQDKRPQLDPKRNRQDDGRVKTKPRNAFTNPGSKVIDAYFKHQKHMDDPYSRAHDLQLQKMKKDKALEAQQKFKPNSFHANTFNKDKNIYGSDVDPKQSPRKQTQFNIYKHQAKWKGTSPNKNGLYGYFTSFPTYMENPPKELKRKSSQDKKDSFNSMVSTLSTPTPSITNNSMNMRRYISNSVGHHY